MINKENKGLTIVEMIITVGIFSIVIVFSTGALLSIMSANKQAQAVKTVVNDLNYALEIMVRGVRSGFDYDCDPSDLDLDDDCDTESSDDIGFKDRSGRKITYRLSNGRLLRDVYNLSSGFYESQGIEMTSRDVVIDKLDFYIRDILSTFDQPNVSILVGGKVFTKGDRSVRFDVETMAVQRFFDK